ncbi:MAG: ComEA family DNA-binding protein [Candidatus Nanopelagicales bacterium]
MFRWPERAPLTDPAVLTARLRAIAGLDDPAPARAESGLEPAVPPSDLSPDAAVDVAARPVGVGRAVLVLALAAVLVAGWLTWRAQGGDVTGSVVTPGVVLPSTSAGPSAPGPAELVVQVMGTVRRPGVVRLPSGARVVDALAAAGGVRPGASAGILNLARRVVDGEQIVVGATAAGPPPSGATSVPPGGGPAARIDLNAADLAALDMLPGVGPVTAQRILDWRKAHGRFASVDQLREVDGIGARTYARLAPLVQVDGLP